MGAVWVEGHAPLVGVPGAMEATGCDGCGVVCAETLIETGERRFGMPGRFPGPPLPRVWARSYRSAPERPGELLPGGRVLQLCPSHPALPATRERLRRAYAGGSRGLRPLDDRLTQGLPPGPPGRILDVGCGSGAFLLALAEAGWECHGVEPDAGAVRAAYEAGLYGVRAGDLTDAGFDAGSFDVVRFWHSLEHVPSPTAQLREARRVLRPGGTLVVGVPNFGSALARRAKARWFYLDVPRHLWHFEPRTLRRVVEGSGFEVSRLDQCSTGDALLGTLDHLRPGRRERLLESRAAWFAALPAAALLDLAGRGDALRLEATPSR